MVLQGLPSHLQTKIIYRYELAPDDDLTMDFDDLLKKVMGLLGAKKELLSLVYVEKEGKGMEDLVGKCDHKTRVNSNLAPPSILVYRSPMVPC